MFKIVTGSHTWSDPKLPKGQFPVLITLISNPGIWTKNLVHN